MIRYILILITVVISGCGDGGGYFEEPEAVVYEFEAISNGQGVYTLQWPKASNATYYIVETRTTSTVVTDYQYPIETSSNVILFDKTKSTTGFKYRPGTYSHRITACDDLGCGDPGEWLLVHWTPPIPPSPAQVDIMVVYDDNTILADGSEESLRDRITGSVADSNQALYNSYLENYVHLNVTMVKMPSNFNYPGDNTLAVTALAEDEYIQTLRDEYKADIVMAIVGGPYPSGGTGKIFVDSDRHTFRNLFAYDEIEQTAYGYVNETMLYTDDYVFTHELFHIFGLQHDLQTFYVDPTISNEYSYAHAYQDAFSCTVMARSCKRELYFAEEGYSQGQYSSNNAWRIMETAHIIAEFR